MPIRFISFLFLLSLVACATKPTKPATPDKTNQAASAPESKPVSQAQPQAATPASDDKKAGTAKPPATAAPATDAKAANAAQPKPGSATQADLSWLENTGANKAVAPGSNAGNPAEVGAGKAAEPTSTAGVYGVVIQAEEEAAPQPAAKPIPIPNSQSAIRSHWKAVPYDSIEGWKEDQISEAWTAFQKSCNALRFFPDWKQVCEASKDVNPTKSQEQRAYFEQRFQAFQINNEDGKSDTGTLTGYYEPILRGTRKRTPPYLYPIYRTPTDLLTIDVATFLVASQRTATDSVQMRGRMQGQRILPYYSRAEIIANSAAFNSNALVWLDDPYSALSLEIQGSGQVQLVDEGQRVIRLGFANHNGHGFRSIAEYLINRGIFRKDGASAEKIQTWMRSNPNLVNTVLAQNPRVIFFEEKQLGDSEGPLGALKIPLTAQRSIAVDPRSIPLGAPVFISSNHPQGAALNRLVMAQDTGSKIQGNLRADFYWGTGEEAHERANTTKQTLKMWVLIPR